MAIDLLLAMMRTDSLAFRLTISSVLWVVVAMAVGGFALSQLFRNAVEESFDAQLSVHLDALLAGSVITRDGRLEMQNLPVDERFSEPYSGWYWQIENNEGDILVRSRSLWDRHLTYDRSNFVPYGNFTVEGQSVRYVSHDVFLSGLDTGVRFVLTGEAAQLEQEIRRFNVILLLSVLLLGAGLAVGIFIQVRYGLKPLHRMGTALSRIREGKQVSLEGDFPDEVQPLADEVNALLAHNRKLVEHARHHVGNLAHALRTPLSVLIGEARGLLKKKKINEDSKKMAEQVEHHGRLMTRSVEHHLARARLVARRKTSGQGILVSQVIGGLNNVMNKIYSDKVIEVDIRPQDILFHGEQDDLEEILGNVIENACKWARRRVRIEVRILSSKEKMMHILIEDDGAGLEESRREEVFARGKRLDEMTPGSGLGLSIVREGVLLYEGDIMLDDSQWGGLAVILRLPLLRT